MSENSQNAGVSSGATISAPKLFISYSWSSPDHEAWVLRLATELRESGIDVVLDKWDLREGHDANAFMERMVADPEIKKVILVCDQAYVDKTDGRRGGVGTEAQIISGEIYQSQAQDKFVAVVKERDHDGNPLVPIYYRSRIYIDLSDPSAYSENFDQLLRWAYDQPLHKKPDLGQKPAFLCEGGGSILLRTSSPHRRAIDALRSGSPIAVPAAAEYLTKVVAEFEKLRLDPSESPFDEAVVKSIESFIPNRNEAIDLFTTLALYLDDSQTSTLLHGFFEGLLPYMERPKEVTTFRDRDWDNFRFLVHELFLYAVASLIRHGRFDSAAYLMETNYYLAESTDYDDNMVPFGAFRRSAPSLAERNNRLNMRRLSLRADLLKERCIGTEITFEDLMQADFVLFMRDVIDRLDERWRWWPETLLYACRHRQPFEIFARAKSLSYFNRIRILLGVEKKDDLLPVLQGFTNGSITVPRWEFDSFGPVTLLGFEGLATRP